MKRLYIKNRDILDWVEYGTYFLIPIAAVVAVVGLIIVLI